MKPFTARPACQFWNKRWNLDEVGEKGVDKISDIYYVVLELDVSIHFSSTNFSFSLKIENKYLYHS